MENKVSRWVTWCNAVAPSLICFTNCLTIVLCYQLCRPLFIVLAKECCTRPKVWFKVVLFFFFLYFFLGVKCCTVPPSSGQNAQLQLCSYCICQDAGPPEDTGVWLWIFSLEASNFWHHECDAFLCAFWFVLRFFCLFLFLTSEFLFNKSSLLSAGGFSKDPTLTTKLRTGSTWKATGTGTTLTCLTSTKYKYTQKEHTPLDFICCTGVCSREPYTLSSRRLNEPRGIYSSIDVWTTKHKNSLLLIYCGPWPLKNMVIGMYWKN